MLFSKATILTAVAALAGLVSAESAKVHVVQVGGKNGELKFYPEELNAAVGDMVQFQFYPRNHSVARSDFAHPCVPLDPATSNGTSGFFSGFMPVQQSDTYMPTFTILVKETTPIWYYCATAKHCENGMAGVINPPKNSADKTLAKYKEAAAGASTVVPGPPSGGETDPDGPSGPMPPTTPGNNTTAPPPPSGNTTAPPGNTTGTPTGTDSPTDTGSGASSFVASAATVILGAVAVAAFFI
ncbi:Cupredoxin [Tirmania nivea]|nr:Cupredoxin [Tirmania nivea]